LSTDILISSDPWENRVAILEDGTLSEIYVEREEKVIGSIYKGKVQNVLPGMGASFVDIGLGRNAFLYVDDINKTPLNIGDVEITSGRSGWTITEKVNRGDDVLVQIVKEPRGLKGARISTNVSLPGRYLILMPTGKYSGVSRKIESAEERNRLKGIMKAIRPDGMATVVRTAAGGVSSAELVADLGVLIRMWHGILEEYKRSVSPALLHKDMNLVYKAARDFITPEVENVYIDDPVEAENVRDFMRLLGPQYLDRIKPYPGGRALFADFKIDEELARLMRPTVKLPSGGSIVIESTEALTVIDINSGKFTGGKNLEDTIVKTNIEAAAEIARQVRLRDIGGIIVCDFIDMNTEGSRNKVIATLEAGLRKDRTRSTIQSFSPLGLLEFTRKRVGKDLGGQLRGPCPTCSGLGTVMSPETVTIQTFRRIATHNNGHGDHVHVAASPYVAAQLEYWHEEEKEALAKQVGKTIDVRIDAAVHPERPLVSWNGELPELPVVRVGDEFEVELLNARTPSGTSALAVVNGRLVEVENSANQAGNVIKIRILDVDGDEILAEPRIPVGPPGAVAAAAGEGGKRKRRRGGRGRKRPLTLAEQTEELRELAEEAAKGLGSRPVIGISTSEEAETEKSDRSTKIAVVAEERAKRGDVPKAKPAASVVGEGSVVRMPGETLSGSAVALLPGERLSGERVGKNAPVVAPVPAPAAAVIPIERARTLAEADPDGEGTTEADGTRKRRRRRRRGGRGNGAPGSETAAVAAAPQRAALAGEAGDEDDEEFRPALETETVAAAETNGEDGARRRRRRRRRRGRGGAGAVAGELPATNGSPAVPDRHIFRVDSDGAAQPTGQTAPREPSRAIAPWNRRPGAVAVDAPPPPIVPPQEPVRVTTPARRRRAATSPASGGSLEATALRALPAPTAQTKAAPAAEVKPKRTKSAGAASPAVAVASEPVATPKPKRAAAGAKKTAAAPATKKTVAAKTRTTVKKAPAAKAPAVKATAVKATSRAKKSSSTAGTTSAKKTTTRKTTRKKS
jgi:ribonuclease G